MKPVPILFLGDSPNLHTGLARIGRDLASLVSGLPQFRVGYMGRGGHGSSQLPFPIFPFPEAAQWGEYHIESIWRDFAGDQPGVIFSVWDPSRLHWFANPIGITGPLADFLNSGRFQRWGYFPIDSYGIGKELTRMSGRTLLGYQRVLAYGMFGAGVITATMAQDVDWIPHGMNLDVFTPRDRAAARMALGVKPSDLVIGCVMTNQARKDWGLAFATIAKLAETHPNLVFWAHVDTMLRSWDIRALANDFDLTRQTVITESSTMSDTELSYSYSACDLTMLPTLGEGFGYPVVESLACGVPCITGRYAGAVELIPNANWLVDPVAERLDTPFNCLRPVYRPADFAERIEFALEHQDTSMGAFCRSSVEHLDWNLLWTSRWQKWFLAGLV